MTDRLFTKKYSTHKRNHSYKGSSHLQVLQALKDVDRFAKVGVRNPELNLTASMERDFFALVV